MNTHGMSFWDTAISIFFVFNSIGMIPVFVALLSRYDQKKQLKIIVRELVISLFVLLGFSLLGNKILDTIGISPSTVGMSGGILLVIIAINMIFPKKEDQLTKQDVPGKEPFIIPLAIPGLAGPGSIATLTVLSTEAGPLVASGAFLLAWIPSLIILLASSYIHKIIGEKGLVAIEKLGGMLISFIGIEIFSKGFADVLRGVFFN